MNSGGYIPQRFASRYIYLELFTDPGAGSCFGIYKINWVKMEKKSQLVGSLFTLYKHFGDFVKCVFCKFSREIIFYLPVNTDKLKFVAFLVFVCSTVSTIAQISSSNNFVARQ